MCPEACSFTATDLNYPTLYTQLVTTMKVVGLISGGKDSCYNLMQCIAAGHSIEAIANLCPKNVDELDSYMYQSIGHEGLSLYAEALGLPLYQREIEGISLNTESIYYTTTEGDEVEDLYCLLKKVKEEHEIEAVSVGAVLSDYQRMRVENVCQRLNLVSLAYMWRRDQSELLQEMIDSGIKAILVKVAAVGLIPEKHLGKSIEEMQPYLHKLNKKYSINVCGEGGEYETFTLDCPLFRKEIVIEEYEMIETPGDVGYLKFKSLKLVEKEKGGSDSLKSDVLNSIKTKDHLQELDLQINSQVSIGYELNTERLLDETKSTNFTEEEEVPFETCFSWASSSGSSVKEALSNIADTLKKRNNSLEDVVNITMFVNNMKNYVYYNTEYNQFFVNNPPTRTCVQVVPFKDDYDVLIDAIICNYVKSEVSFNSRQHRETLHVQSISHWAPANIGPYSQAVKVGKLIFIAGMIGMIPVSLQMVDDCVEKQTRLAYKHLERILSVISSKATLKSIVQAVCYVTSEDAIDKIKRLMEDLNKFQICLYVVVPELPKAALVEWQTWSHLENTTFIYEEATYVSKTFNANLRQRSSKNGSISALIAIASCEISKMRMSDFEGFVQYCIEKMNTNEVKKEIHLTLYHSPELSSQVITNSLNNICNKSSVSLCIVPVLLIEERKTLSIILIKY